MVMFLEGEAGESMLARLPSLRSTATSTKLTIIILQLPTSRRAPPVLPGRDMPIISWGFAKGIFLQISEKSVPAHL